MCAFNPAKPGMLATGYALDALPEIVDDSSCNFSRSKDAVINLWDLPNPSTDLSRFAEYPRPPLVIDYFSKPEQGDLTSLHWNADGSLLAVGSYDAVLRICTPSGELYFSYPQHSVNMIIFLCHDLS